MCSDFPNQEKTARPVPEGAIRGEDEPPGSSLKAPKLATTPTLTLATAPNHPARDPLRNGQNRRARQRRILSAPSLTQRIAVQGIREQKKLRTSTTRPDLLPITTIHHVNLLCVTLGETQRLCRTKDLPEYTIIQLRTWNLHQKNMRMKGKSTEEYLRYKAMDARGRSAYMVPVTLDGKEWCAAGPFRTEILIEGLPFQEDVLVVSDEEFPHDIMIGKGILRPVGTDTCVVNQGVDDESDPVIRPLSINGKAWWKVNESRVNAVVNVGAAVSAWDAASYEELGGRMDELIQIKMDLRTTANEPLQVLGLTRPLSLRIGGADLFHSFVIIRHLPTSELILGRDFLTKYDVAVDVPGQNLRIMNPKLLYSIKTIPTECEENINLSASLQRGETIMGGTQRLATCGVRTRRSGLGAMNPRGYWLGMVQPPQQRMPMTEKGVSNAAAIVIIKDGETRIPFVSTLHREPEYGQEKLEHECVDVQISPEDSAIPVKRIVYRYQRLTPEGIGHRYVQALQRPERVVLCGISPAGQSMWRGQYLPNREVGDPFQYYYGGDPCQGDEYQKPFQLLEQEQWRHQEGGQGQPTKTGALQEQYFDVSGNDKGNEQQPKVKPFPLRPPTDHLRDRLTAEQAQEVEDIIDEYQEIFLRSPAEVGRTLLMQHKIETPPGVRPPSDPYRRLSPVKRKAADNQVQILIEAGVIRPSRSPYGAAIVIAKKKDGAPRFCIDFRRVNDITKKDVFPLPRIDDCLEKLGGAKWFTSLDMGNAFWQIPMDEESIEKTAFRTPEGLYEWTRMPFGLCNATSTFQRLMTRLVSRIGSAMGNLVLCYVDDILIASSTTEDHIQKIREVFRVLKEAGLKLKAGKCELFKTSVKFLGRVVDGDGIRPDPESIAKVDSWCKPTSNKMIASYLGFANYYREFIKDYSKIVAPLNQLKNKNKTMYLWTDACEDAFREIIKRLKSIPVIALARDEGRYILETEGSDVAIAAVLSQEQLVDGKKQWRVVCHGSRALRGPEKQYGAPKLEMLAALTFIEHFRVYLEGATFLLKCDQMALRWLKTYGAKSSLTARWLQRLDGFFFEHQHVEAKEHLKAGKKAPVREPEDASEDQRAPSAKFMDQEAWEELAEYAQQPDPEHEVEHQGALPTVGTAEYLSECDATREEPEKDLLVKLLGPFLPASSSGHRHDADIPELTRGYLQLHDNYERRRRGSSGSEHASEAPGPHHAIDVMEKGRRTVADYTYNDVRSLTQESRARYEILDLMKAQNVTSLAKEEDEGSGIPRSVGGLRIGAVLLPMLRRSTTEFNRAPTCMEKYNPLMDRPQEGGVDYLLKQSCLEELRQLRRRRIDRRLILSRNRTLEEHPRQQNADGRHLTPVEIRMCPSNIDTVDAWDNLPREKEHERESVHVWMENFLTPKPIKDSPIVEEQRTETQEPKNEDPYHLSTVRTTTTIRIQKAKQRVDSWQDRIPSQLTNPPIPPINIPRLTGGPAILAGGELGPGILRFEGSCVKGPDITIEGGLVALTTAGGDLVSHTTAGGDQVDVGWHGPGNKELYGEDDCSSDHTNLVTIRGEEKSESVRSEITDLDASEGDFPEPTIAMGALDLILREELKREDFDENSPIVGPAKGRILLDQITSIAHTLSADVAMRKGLPYHVDWEFECCNSIFHQKVKVGGVAVTLMKDVEDQQFIYHLITKTRDYHHATYPALQECIFAMRAHALDHGVKRICMPKLACAWDGLKWKDVQALLHEAFNYTGIDIEIYPELDQ